MSSLQEQATINFYTWEVRGRGYYHFDDPIDIEPPFTPFIPLPNTKEKFKEFVSSGFCKLCDSRGWFFYSSKNSQSIR